MGLSNVSDEKVHVHLLYTDSSLLEMKVYDTLKKVCNADLDSIFNIETISGFNEMVDLLNIQPFLADKWLVVLNYKKSKKLIEKFSGIFGSDTARFLIKVNNYKEFKEVKNILKKGINEMYLSYLPLKDIYWLLEGYGLSQKLVEFIYKSYSREPEKVMRLLKKLEEGEKVSTRKEITEICGIGTSNITSFAISLLSINVKTEKGLGMSLRKKLKDAMELSKIYGISTFRNYLSSSLKDMINIKEMYLNGDIYDSIRDIPECFDEKKLSRYKSYLKSILECPIEDLIYLYLKVQESGRWSSDVDLIEFLYKIYVEKGVNE